MAWADAHSYEHPGGAKRQTTGNQPERYAYAVYCEATRNFAIGGSDPEIIVM